MATFAKVRRMYFRDQLSISEIARRTSLTRNTIKKWLRTDSATEPRYRRKSSQTKLSPFIPQLVKALQTDLHRPKRDRRTAKVLFQELVTAGFGGDYSRVTAFIRHWRTQTMGHHLKSAFVPLRFALGEAFQFDWSEEHAFIGGIHRKVLLAHMKLCASRAFALMAYPSQSHEMLFDAHTRAFQMLGGVPLRGIYDNMKTAVDKVLPGKERIINARFHAMTAHYLFDTEFCNVASGWEKGIVEKNVQDRRRHIWQAALALKFASFDELNAWLEQQCQLAWQQLRHPEYPELTLAELRQDEQLHMMPFPGAFDGYTEVLARVSSTCLITFQRNRYSVPCHWANQMVSVRLYPSRLVIYADQQVIAEHVRSFERSQTFYHWQHYLPLLEQKPGALRNGAPFNEMPADLRQLQQRLLRHKGGDRIMAKVLGCVPKYGLETVQVAVALMLETGKVSAEHVLNVLARLHEAPRPDALEVALALNEPPLADSQRYDQLHQGLGVS
ncbi:IS21 family transposase (plasmid) [Chitinibacter bivalviorum]|uniref:IS21 family transposase n=1 Tax=Chitinibacter bivalviorum TaxID=2739434 RepID=A0A7H9BN63_9NEIS|nr:IS21 family transposase [Chitinibacter bivalviorum]QLG87983.1 IS21 family transposase [Chitinibacter bivalviorum]QLG88236.1 IS21 family transposase [Chitinibacter bivalviorum]QLG88331.1 IS21 family transposase [Chitinibacter bivalviorum]QLG89029.1 IS21 family transposase [Chitinibacter bivalviorum]QLG90083.1 IS21 family transposase [Chitinibacter bivalviorum]